MGYFDGGRGPYIKAGIGAPILTEQLLALGVTGCKRIVFVGSVGALDLTIGIGDIVIPVYSVCDDGMSRYLYSDDLSLDPFGEKSYPDPEMNQKLIDVTQKVCEAANVRWHLGRTFSLDTIFAQFAHIDTIMSMGCNTIEMETAAFRAAAMMKIPIEGLPVC